MRVCARCKRVLYDHGAAQGGGRLWYDHDPRPGFSEQRQRHPVQGWSTCEGKAGFPTHVPEDVLVTLIRENR